MISNEPPATALVREPVYHQLNEQLRALLGRDKFTAGAQFLTERDISQRFGVSRVTANKALSQLVMAGALEFRKGVGTFVRGEALQNDLRSLVSFTQKAKLSGRKPQTKVLGFTTVTGSDAGEEVRSALKIGPKDRLYHFHRLRLADGEPVILEYRYVVAELCPGLDRRRVGGSLYSLFEDELGLKLTGSQQTIRALNLTGEQSRLLRVKPGTAALWVHAVGFARQPLWIEDTIYRGDAYEFENSLRRNSDAAPARATLRKATDERTATRLVCS